MSLGPLDKELTSLYIFTLLVWFIFCIVFIYGFKLVSEKYQNNLLKTSSYILIISIVIFYGYSSLTVVISPIFWNNMMRILIPVIFGGANILFGIALLKLKPYFGSLATGTGLIVIITGVTFLSVILQIIGIFLFMPLYIFLASMILFRAARKIETISTV